MGGLRSERQLRRVFTLCFLGGLTWLSGFGSRAEAGGNRPRSGRVYVPTACVVQTSSVTAAPLGSGFTRTPYMQVRGNFPTGGGYTPLDGYGDGTLSLYGPLSSLRVTSAPVLTYTRGYDGRTVVSQGTSFSTPNLPALTPVVYPTQANNYYGFRQSGTPPWWPNAINWIDQN
jgi:hypothetical protein